MARTFVQMGFGEIDLLEHDLVEDSNRNRGLFFADDVGTPKAHALIKNLAPYAVGHTRLRSFFMSFEEWAASRYGRRPEALPYDVICCGVDSFAAIRAVCEYGIFFATRIVFTNVSADAEACRIFIQRPGQACFGCYRPTALLAQRPARPCLPVPAVADIVQVAAGMAARATVGEILGQPIGPYNCREFALFGFDITKTIARNPSCLLCSHRKEIQYVRPKCSDPFSTR